MTVPFLGITSNPTLHALQLGADSSATASSIPSGSTILVGVLDIAGGSGPPGTMTDDASNTYTLASSIYSTPGGLVLFAGTASSALSSGQKITYSGPTAYVFAAYALGSTSTIDKTHTGSGNSSSLSSGASGATTFSGELFFGAGFISGASISSLGGGWTVIDHKLELFSGGYAFGYLNNTGTSSQTFTASASTTNNWISAVASLKPPPMATIGLLSMPMLGL